jgi:hypothetical protein
MAIHLCCLPQAQGLTRLTPLSLVEPKPEANKTPSPPTSCFDSFETPVVPVEQTARRLDMSDNDALYAIRHPDGSVSLYIDEEYAAERGVDPETLTRVEIPRELFTNGTVQQVREYVAVYLEAQKTGTA